MGMFNSSNKGCVRKLFGGCFSVLLLFVTIVALLSSIEFPEFDFQLNEKVESGYLIDMDSTSSDKKILTTFEWKFVASDFSKRKYSLSFKLLESEVQNALQLIERIGRMSLQELGLNPSLYDADPDTRAEYVWVRIYNLVYTNSFHQMKSITSKFNDLFKIQSLNSKDRVLFVISFVQNIKYDRPGGVLDLMAPLATLAKKFGDCDTKAILLYVLLERMGIDCAMMWSQHYKHAMLGVRISTRGDYKKYNGKKYYFLETTYPGWAIGELPPDFKNKRFWYISEIDKEESGKLFDFDRDNSNNSTNRNNKPSPARK